MPMICNHGGEAAALGWAGTRDGLIAIRELIRCGRVHEYAQAAEQYLTSAIKQLGDGTDPVEAAALEISGRDRPR